MTRGSRGATVVAGGAETTCRRSRSSADPTGAGDAFCVAYIAARNAGSRPAGSGPPGDGGGGVDAGGGPSDRARRHRRRRLRGRPRDRGGRAGGAVRRRARAVLNLPRVVAAAAAGSTVVAVVDARPPMLVSHDAGVTWRESGRGLPAGTAVAVSRGRSRPDRLRGAEPALRLAQRRRVLDGARGELPEIEALGAQGILNSPRATTTAEPPTRTRSIARRCRRRCA